MTHITEVKETASGDVARLDFRFEVRRGRIRDFAINVSVLEGDRASDVYRVDTKHGRLHEQRFWVSPELRTLDYADYNAAFAAKKEEVYRNYERWIRHLGGACEVEGRMSTRTGRGGGREWTSLTRW